MRIFTTAITLSAVVLSVNAGNVTCSTWTFLSPASYLLCHFTPSLYTAVEHDVVSAVETVADRVKELVKFDISIHPITLAYDYITTTEQEGVDAANAQLKDAASNFTQATIGFGKQAASVGLSIYQLSTWSDINYCLATQAVTASVGSYSNLPNTGDGSNTQVATARKKRATPISASTAAQIAKTCITEHFQQPLQLKAAGPNQQVGATIADIASFLVPVGIEAEGGAALAEDAFDLAIPGAEDTTRVYQKAEGSSVGQHFTSIDDAQGTARELKDRQWQIDNCVMCTPPISAAIARRQRSGGSSGLDRRGFSLLGLCCPKGSIQTLDEIPTLPGSNNVLPDAFKQTDTALEDAELPSQSQGWSVSFTEAYEGLLRSDSGPIVAPVEASPEYILRSPESTTDLDQLVFDLEALSTGQLGWSTKLSQIMDSDTVFAKLRSVFTGTDAEVAEPMEITKVGYRQRSISKQWINKPDPSLKIWQDFTNQAVEDAKTAVTSMLKLSPDDAGKLDGFIEYFFVVPSKTPTVNALEIHADDGIMSFGASDAQGLVIYDSVEDGSFTPVVKNAYYCLKGTEWPKSGPSLHAVQVTQGAENGRVSLVLHIKDVNGEFGTEFGTIIKRDFAQ